MRLLAARADSVDGARHVSYMYLISTLNESLNDMGEDGVGTTADDNLYVHVCTREFITNKINVYNTYGHREDTGIPFSSNTHSLSLSLSLSL